MDDEQVYQDVKGIIEAVKVIISGTTVVLILCTFEFNGIDHFLQGGDKDTFRLQLNHVLCCRPWGVLPDMLDLFEQMNHGRWKNIFDKSQRVTLSSQGKTWATA